MIEVYRIGDKIFGQYKIFISNAELMNIRYVSNYLSDKCLTELKKQENSEIFTYNIIKATLSDTPDLFGRLGEVIIEFVPNKELAEELKLVTERLIIGL
jgi:hypothetical protein